MRQPRSLDTLMTKQDHQFLRAIHCSLDAGPEPVVSMNMYCAAIDANDFITRQNRILRQQRRRLVGYLRAWLVWRSNAKRVLLGIAGIAAVVLASRFFGV